MNVEIIVRINGRAVAVVEQQLTGDALEREQQNERLKDRVGQVVLEEGFAELAGTLRRPCCYGKPMKNMARCSVTMDGQLKGLRNGKRESVTSLRNYFRSRIGITDYQ